MRPRAVRRDRPQCIDERALRRGDERRLVRGHAGEEQRLARANVVLRRRGEEVDAPEAVHLQVDEAGHRDAATCAAGETDVDDDAVLDVDVASDELATDERGLDPEPHRPAPSATLTEP